MPSQRRVSGDAATLERLLRDEPELIHARSAREHRATLLHYVAANGVENYRQKTPRNAVAIAEILLQAGAEVDAGADVYGGGATTLGLAATSAHPRHAGVQKDLIEVLLKHGARLDVRGGGNNHSMVDACLANGCPEAAEYLASRGAALDFAGAAGIGRLDVLKTFFGEQASVKANASQTQMQSALSWACWYGHPDVVDFLLEHGMDVGARLSVHGEGQTALHVAAFAAQVNVVKVLLRRDAPVNVTDTTWGTPPLVWALHAWSEEPKASPERYHEVVAMLVAAGAVVKPELLDDEKVRADPKMLAALTGRSLEEV
jgi:ankyrin repeat protein